MCIFCAWAIQTLPGKIFEFNLKPRTEKAWRKWFLTWSPVYTGAPCIFLLLFPSRSFFIFFLFPSLFLQRKGDLDYMQMMGPVRIRHSSHDFGWQSSHSVDLAGWQAKMASIENWIPWRNAHKPHWKFLLKFYVWAYVRVSCKLVSLIGFLSFFLAELIYSFQSKRNRERESQKSWQWWYWHEARTLKHTHTHTHSHTIIAITHFTDTHEHQK